MQLHVNRKITFLIVPMGALLLYYFLRNGHTWQLIPLEATVILLAWQAWRNPGLKRAGWIIAFTVLGVGLTLLAFFIMPRFRIPKPSGNYFVGVTYATQQTNRPETFTPDARDHRTLPCKIWYPASARSENMNPYLEGGKGGIKTLTKLANLPAFLFSHFSSIKTHGFTNAPIAEGSFPVLTFSHGYGSWFGQNTALMEELASRGFVVIAIAHSHQTIVAARDENTLITFERVVPLDSPANRQPDRKFEKFLAEADQSKFTEMFYQQLEEASPFTHECAGIWAADIRSAIDYVMAENRNEKSIFHHRIDTSKIGAFGMSFGGAASGEAALHDPRIRAGMNMDGTAYGTWAQDTISVPFMMLEAKRSSYGYSMYAPLRARSTSAYLNLLFVDAEHYNFTDVNLFSPIFRWLGVTGKVDGTEMIAHLNTIVPDFFIRSFQNELPKEQDYVVPGKVEKATF
ncbi:MAG: alpha/beta hydrolase family protein [Flammeovirgaceae bacterium]